MKRRLNLRFLLIAVAVLAVVGVGGHFLHGFQVRRTAIDLKERAKKAYEEGNYADAVPQYQRYLMLRPDDSEAKFDLGRALQKSADTPRKLWSARELLEKELALHADNDEVRRDLVDLNLQFGRYIDARYHARVLLAKELLATLERTNSAAGFKDQDRSTLQNNNGSDKSFVESQQKARAAFGPGVAKDRKAIGKVAELELLLGESLEGLGTYELARDEYEAASKDEPGRLQGFMHLSRLYITRLGNPRVDEVKAYRADQSMDDMVKENQSAAAYVARARYFRVGGSGADRDKHGALIETVACGGGLAAAGLLHGGSTSALVVKAELDMRAARALQPNDAEVLLESALVARGRGWFGEASHYAQDGLRQYPADARMYYVAGQLHLQQGQRKEARAVVDKGLEKLPGNRDLTFLLADLINDDGDEAQFKKLTEKLGQLNADPAMVDYMKGSRQAQAEEWGQAAASLERAHAGLAVRYPDLARRVALLLGKCYERLENADKAYTAYRRATPEDPNDPLWLPASVGTAQALAVMPRLNEAIEIYDNLVGRSPRLGVPLARLIIQRNLGLPHEKRDWGKVDKVLVAVAQQFPNDTDVVIVRAQYLAARASVEVDDGARADGYKEAHNGLRKAIEELDAKSGDAKDAEPKKLALWLTRMGIEASRGKEGNPLRELDDADQKLGDRVQLRLARCPYLMPKEDAPAAREKASASLGKLEEGVERFKDADQLLLWTGLAEAYAAVPDADKARACWNQVIKRKPHDLGARLRLFDLAVAANNENAMDAAIAEIKGLEGEQGTLWRYASAVQLVNRYEQQGPDSKLLTDARKLLEPVAKQSPNLARVPALLGRIEFLSKKPDAALTLYQKAIELGDRRFALILETIKLMRERGRDPKEINDLLKQLPDRSAQKFGGITIGYAMQMNELQRAKDVARQSVKEDPKDYKRQLTLGQVWLAIDPKDKAGDAQLAFEAALDLKKDVPETWTNYIILLARKDHLKEAAEQLIKAQKNVPVDKHPLAYARCFAAMSEAETDETKKTGYLRFTEQLFVSAGQAADQSNPKDFTTLRAVADYFVARRNFDEAERLLRVIADGAPDAKERADARRLYWFVVFSDNNPYAKKQELVRQMGGLDAPIDPKNETAEDQRARAFLTAIQGHRADREKAIAILEDIPNSKLVPLTSEDQYLLASLYESVSRTDEARRLVRAVLEKDPKNLEYLVTFIRMELGQNLVLQEKSLLEADKALASAGEMVTRMETIEGNNNLSWRTVALRARVTYQLGKTKDAMSQIRAYAEAKEAKKVDFPLLAVARLLEEFGDKDGADFYYKRFEDGVDAKGKPGAKLLRARFLGHIGDFGEALKLCDEVRNMPSVPSELPIEVAQEILVREDASKAGKARAPEDQNRVAGWIEKALKDGTLTAQRKGALLEAKANLLILRNTKEGLAQAEGTYRDCLLANPKDVVAMNNLAWLLAIQKKNVDDALDLIDKAINIRGPLANLVDTRATVYLARGQADEAIRELKEVVADNTNAFFVFHLAQAYWLRNVGDDRQEVEGLLTKAHTLHLDVRAMHTLDRENPPELFKRYRDKFPEYLDP